MRDASKYHKCLCTDCGTSCDLFEHEETQELVCIDCLNAEEDEDMDEEE